MSKRRKTLRKLDQEALIDIILMLEGRLNTLEKLARDLRESQGDPAPPKKTSKNSSLPPSQDQKSKPPRKPQHKRGPKAGHSGTSRQRATPDEIIECRLDRCPHCDADLSQQTHEEIGRRQQVDIPPIQPIVREARRYRCTCPDCDQSSEAPYPPEFAQGQVFGAHLESLIIYLHQAHPLSYQRVQRILSDVMGLEISMGALVNAVKRSADALATAAETIRQEVQASDVVGSDETRMYLNGATHWQWVFQNQQWVYFYIHRRRHAAVIDTVMGDAQPAVWVSDLLASQLKHPAQQLQICLAHQLRDLQLAVDAHRCRWAYEAQGLLRRAMGLGRQRALIPAAAYERQVAVVTQAWSRHLERVPHNADSQRLRRRFIKHQADTFVFLQREDVPPTNNASEQALRNSVIRRKVTGGFRTQWGAKVYADLTSVLETARRQGRQLFQTLADVLAGKPAFNSQGE